jgi:hypothetical protein
MKLSYSPWGSIQHQETVARGIVCVSTASHGGFWLAPDRWAVLVATFPTFPGKYGGEQWLEEDAEVCAAVIRWPAEFKPESVRHAVRMVQEYSGDYMKELRDWLATDAGKAARDRAEEQTKVVSELWETGCQGTQTHPDGRRGWWALLTHQGTGAKQQRFFMKVCEKHLYTQAELDAVSEPMPERELALA